MAAIASAFVKQEICGAHCFVIKVQDLQQLKLNCIWLLETSVAYLSPLPQAR